VNLVRELISTDYTFTRPRPRFILDALDVVSVVMATNDETPSFEDFPEPDASNDDDGSNWIDLEAGDEIVGRITGFNPESGRNGVIEIDGRPMWLNQEMRNQLIARLVEGASVAVRCSEDTDSFTDDDGEKVTYHPKEARFRPRR